MGEGNFYRLSELPSLQIYRHYTMEKQQYTPSRLPEIVCLLKPKGGVTYLCEQKCNTALNLLGDFTA